MLQISELRPGAIVLGAALAFATITGAKAETPPNMLVIASQLGAMTSLDPAETFDLDGNDYINNVYDRLVAFDPMNLGELVGGIASSWTISGDGRTFRFQLRKGLTFHSGNPVTAEDVVYSLHRAALLKKTPSFILETIGIKAATVREMVTAPGQDEVVIAFSETFSPDLVLKTLSTGVASIIDSKTVQAQEQSGDFGTKWLATHSAGSGAYRLGTWKPNDSYSLEANANYWRLKPQMNRVFVRHIPEASAQRLLLEKGDIDIARSLSPDEIAALATGAKDIKATTDVSARLVYLGLNQKNAILGKPEVAAALKYLVDYDGMVGSFLKGQFTVHQSFVPATIAGAVDDNPYSFDMAKAKSLLAAAGYPNGFEISMHVRNDPVAMQTAEAIQSNWAKANIKLKLVTGTGSQVIGPYRNRTHDIYLGTWASAFPDPQSNAGSFAFNPDNSDGSANSGSLAWRNAWDDPDATRAVEAAVRERDSEKRLDIYRRLQQRLFEKSPFVVMFQQFVQTAMRRNVSSFVTGGAISPAYFWTVTKE